MRLNRVQGKGCSFIEHLAKSCVFEYIYLKIKRSWLALLSCQQDMHKVNQYYYLYLNNLYNPAHRPGGTFSHINELYLCLHVPQQSS